jgi:MraZ protein
VVSFPITGRLFGTVAMLLLTGGYEHTVDDKSRLFIPNKLRSQIDTLECGSDFLLVPGPNGILCLYPPKAFARMAKRVAAETETPEEALALERLLYGLSMPVELDKQGRLLLSEKVRKRAGLGDDLVLTGMDDHIEIWNIATWEEYRAEHLPALQQQMMKSRHEAVKEATKQTV